MKKVFLIIAIVIIIIGLIATPRFATIEYYYTSDDINHFISQVKSKDEKAAISLLLYYSSKDEEKNSMLLKCYLYQQNIMESKELQSFTKVDMDLTQCPEDPLDFIQDKTSFLDDIKYKMRDYRIDSVAYITSDGRDGTSTIFEE